MCVKICKVICKYFQVKNMYVTVVFCFLFCHHQHKVIHKAIFSGELAVFLTEHFFFHLYYNIKCCVDLYAPESLVSLQSLGASTLSRNTMRVLSLFVILHFSHLKTSLVGQPGRQFLLTRFSTSAPEAEQIPIKSLHGYPEKSSADLNN